jgi:N-formylglutamate amidohydrolase
MGRPGHVRHLFQPAFDIFEPPDAAGPVVFNSPHSGRHYPAEFLAQSRLDERGLRRSEDCHIDRVFFGVTGLRLPLMCARFPRAYLDVNREPYELDPRMFDGRLPAQANTRSMRVAGGLGTVPRIVGDGQDIYARRLPVAEALHRIETLYRPYHRALRQLVARAEARFGQAILIDCHSMPAASLGQAQDAGIDIVVGDRYGTSCAPLLTEHVARLLSALGYTVQRNKPYAGGFITEHYGAPLSGVHALQIEINRSIYMDETTLDAHAGLDRLRADMTTLAESLIDLRLPASASYRDAAE